MIYLMKGLFCFKLYGPNAYNDYMQGKCFFAMNAPIWSLAANIRV